MLRAAVLALAISAGIAPVGRAEPHRAATTAPNRVMAMTATAYCQSGVTKSGAWTRPGFIAADTRVLPVGSVVQVESIGRAEPRIYTVMDTGALVRGRRIDIYIPNCRQAKRFGRRRVRVHVLSGATD